MLARHSLTLTIFACVGLLAGCALESKPEPTGGPPGLGAYTRTLPDLTLPQATRGVRSLVALAKEGGAVLVVTAPTHKNGDAQQGWAEHLLTLQPSGKAHLVFIEDFGPSWFPGIARDEIRKRDNPYADPVMLIDEEGRVRKALGAREDETIILVYRADLGLALAIEGEPSRAAAEKAWRALAAP